MAYFLKKSNTNNDIYLQIYESFYDPERKGSAHRSHKPIGYVKKLIASGIDDPISHYQEEVDKLNASHKSIRNRDNNCIHQELPDGAYIRSQHSSQ